MADEINLHPVVRKALNQARRSARRLGIQFIVTSAFRDSRLQKHLFRRRQIGQHPLPVAAPGRSTHEYGLAVDIVTGPGQLGRLVNLMTSFGWTWGGKADPVHFQAVSQQAWSDWLRNNL